MEEGGGWFFSVKAPNGRTAGSSPARQDSVTPVSHSHSHTGCPLPRTLPSTGTNRAGEETPPASHRHSRADSPKPRGGSRREGSGRCWLRDPHSIPSRLWRPQDAQPRTGLGTIPAGRTPRCLSVPTVPSLPALPAGSGGDPGSSREQDSVWPPLLAARVAHLSSFSSRLWDN